ncbi:tail assembly protein [Escherichia coli]|nr:tail assembly protein [Escherichia coli]
MARICLYGDLQRFGRRIDLRVKTGAEAIRALATQLPAFRQKLSDGWYQVRGRRIDLRVKTGAEAIRALATQLPAFRQKLSDGWYQVRIAGRDVSTSGLTAQLHETLPDGAVIHIVPRVAGAKSGGVFQIVLGAAAIAGSFFTAGATLAAWGAAIGAGGMTGILFSLGASMVLGGVAQMLAPKARTPRTQTTDNGKQNTYFSSLDNMVAQGNVLPVLYGEMRVGSRVVSQEISTADEGDGGQVVVIGR